MDIRGFLAEQGLGEDEIVAIVGNDKSAKAMTAALTRYEEGLSALTAAQRERAEATEFWEQKVTPALANVDRRVATADAEAARYKAYLTSLKSQGYDVPDDLVNSAAPPPTPPAASFTREDFQREMGNTGPSLVALTQLSNEYTDLYGAPYLNMESDFAEAQKARKPMTQFVREKYAFHTKREERSAKKQQETIDAKVSEQYKAKEAELVAKYGSNANISAPLASKFDKIEQMRDGGKDSWKSSAGKDAARKDRLTRFENVVM